MENSSNFEERVRQGHREEVAAFMLKLRSRILRRVRGKLRAAGITAVDTEDIFATCARRVDRMCLEGRLVALAEDDMAKYVLRMAENTATNKILAECRRQHTLQRLKRELPDLHDEIVAEPNQSVIESRLPKLTEGDREILELRLRGLSHVQIANALKVPLTTERTRWQRMRARVKAFMAPAAHSEERRIPQSTNRNSS